MADITIDNVVQPGSQDQFTTCPRHLSKSDCDEDCIHHVWKTPFVQTESQQPTPAKPTHVSAEHLAQLRQSAADTALAAAQYEIAHLKLSLATAHKDINVLRHEQAVEHAGKMRAEAHTQAQAVKEQHHVLAQQLAIHYGVDWNSTSYVPETGELIATPQDSPP